MPKVDITAYEGREQAYVKHCLLEEYLPQLAYKVGSIWDAIVYIDGFSGPWKTTQPDLSDSSFGVATSQLQAVSRAFKQAGKDLSIHCILVERDKKSFERLNSFAQSTNRDDLRVSALNGAFVAQIDRISELVRASGKTPFKFVFLDPKGWADIPMPELCSLLRDRSCEVLVNLMTSDIRRFVNQSDREKSFNQLFGRAEAIRAIRDVPLASRVDRAVQEYGESLRTLCGFAYVSSAVIFEPQMEDIRYYLIYGTNHFKGIEVFKQAESKAAKIQDDVRFYARTRKTGQPEFQFGTSPKTAVALGVHASYQEKARQDVLGLLRSAKGSRILYRKLFCSAMAYPLVQPSDLIDWIKGWSPKVALELVDGANRRVPRPDEDDAVIVNEVPEG